MSDRMGRKANYDEWVEHIFSLSIGMTKKELIPFDEEELSNFVEEQNYHLDYQLSLNLRGFMQCLVVIEPSAKVKRKHCLNKGDEDANSNREYVDGGIQSTTKPF